MQDPTDLPLADFDHIPEGELQHRIRSLNSDQLQQLIDYERAHADRMPVKQLLTTRQEDVANGAELAPGGGEDDASPGASRHGSRVSPDSAGDPGQPLRHGVAGQTPNRG